MNKNKEASFNREFLYLRNYIILFFLLIPITSLHSQFKINVGFKAGVLSAHQTAIYQWDEDTYASRWGFGGGAFLDASFNKSISILVELDYMQQGWYDDDVYYKKYSMNVISFPIMLKLNAQAGKFTPYLVTGPRLDLILNLETPYNVFDNSEKLLYGITFGLGCERIVYKNYSVLAEVRYNYDLESMFRTMTVIGEGSTNYSRSLAFLAGVKF